MLDKSYNILGLCVVAIISVPAMAQFDPSWNGEPVVPVSRVVSLKSPTINEEDSSPATVGPRQQADYAAPMETRDKTAAGFDFRRIVSIFGSLAVVLGLFALTVLGLRLARPAGRDFLPEDLVRVLGRTVLPGGRDLHLVQVGNKLLLLAISPTHVQTLTEITDPTEVRKIMEPFGQHAQIVHRLEKNDEPGSPEELKATNLSA